MIFRLIRVWLHDVDHASSGDDRKLESGAAPGLASRSLANFPGRELGMLGRLVAASSLEVPGPSQICVVKPSRWAGG